MFYCDILLLNTEIRRFFMRYNIEGDSLPIVEVNLDPNETIVT